MVSRIKPWGKVVGFEKRDKSLFVFGEEEDLRIDVLSERTVRFHYSKNKNWNHNYSFVIEKFPPLKDFTVTEKDGEIVLSTAFLVVAINKEKGKISIFDKEGDLILSDYENLGYGRFKNKVFSYKELRNEEAFLGFGERVGGLNKKGKRLINWNTDDPNHYPTTDPLYQSHPFFIAWNPKKSYGIFFDNTFRSYFDMGKESNKYYYFYAENGELDYYFFYGPTPKDVIEEYTYLTGRYYLPPIWALGYQQSRWSYASEEEVREIAKNFRERKIPCDVIYLDIDYMEGFRVFTTSCERFPNFEKMINDLNREGFKIVTIIDPGVKRDVNYDVYKEGVEKDYFCRRSDGTVYIGHVWPGECAFPDFVREEVRVWWGEKQKSLIEKGVSGIWNDMNEPASFENASAFWGKTQDPEESKYYLKTFPQDVLHGKGDRFTHDEIHNVYGLLMAKASFEGWKRARPNLRPLIITRAGFSGVQKYSSVWTGDNKSWWEHLYMSFPMLQNLGISGVPFIGADVGGFGEDCTEELFIRWIEAGIFYPFFRNHSAINTRRQEPWSFSEEAEKIARKYITLRYQLIPYLYSLFWEAKEKGIPPLRALILEYPEDKEAIHNDDEFMLGAHLLVAPIYREGARARLVYLPHGEWYNFWTEEKLEGPAYISVSSPIELIPIFVKAGTILPLWKSQNYVGEEKQDVLELRVFPGEGEFIYYEDDGVTWDYEKGKFNLVKFSLKKEGNLKIEYIHKGYQSERKIFRIVPLKGKVIEIEDNGNIEIILE
ncbi:MAG: alpha-glucosidase [Dictyoglomus sp. NZ13-RE01]|nr:MAG: alpha-glucosidase [Dictyoglomus sp. NZ13-RE01]